MVFHNFTILSKVILQCSTTGRSGRTYPRFIGQTAVEYSVVSALWHGGRNMGPPQYHMQRVAAVISFKATRIRAYRSSKLPSIEDCVPFSCSEIRYMSWWIWIRLWHNCTRHSARHRQVGHPASHDARLDCTSVSYHILSIILNDKSMISQW